MKLNILSVDDSKAVLKYIEWSFKEKHHTLTTVDNGQDAIRLVSKNKYDLILLDWEMPDPNGIEVLKIVRSKNKLVKIAMLTSKNDEKEIIEALDLGADDYIMKPFTPDLLDEKILEIFE